MCERLWTRPACHALYDWGGGHATLVRAPEDVRNTVDVFQPLSEPVMTVTQKLKAAFDPIGILNPGRMYAGV